jgi:chemotaxis protein methyltransferase CheR
MREATSPSGGRTAPPRSAGAEDREFAMSDDEFRRIADRVLRTAGIVLKDHKRQMVYTRLARRLRALGLSSFAAYLELLDSPAGAAELQDFTNAVTTNLTSFFREAHHFDHLRDAVVAPRLAEGRRRLRIWSAGCSTGEEPYSIALALLGKGGPASRGGADLRILATDLDTNVLAQAEAGLYRADRAEDVPAALRAGALIRRPPDRVEVAPGLRAAVAFRRLNLLEDWPFRGPFDAIFCRNVLIYFDAETKARLVRRFAEHLDAEGALYLGHSESLLGEHPLLRSEGRTIYRRRG